MTDPNILNKARQEERVLLTVDLDFAQLLVISDESLPSVILFRLGNVSREVVNRHLLAILNDKEIYQLVYQLYRLTEKEIKIVEGGK
jgi:predicted nuclease of predicted toxin-antitoxin system